MHKATPFIGYGITIDLSEKEKSNRSKIAGLLLNLENQKRTSAFSENTWRSLKIVHGGSPNNQILSRMPQQNKACSEPQKGEVNPRSVPPLTTLLPFLFLGESRMHSS